MIITIIVFIPITSNGTIMDFEQCLVTLYHNIYVVYSLGTTKDAKFYRQRRSLNLKLK